MRPTLVPFLLGAALVVTGCGQQEPAPAPAAAPAPTPSAVDHVTADDARAALAASVAGAWGTGADALGDRPATPAGFSEETMQQAYDFAVAWLNQAINDDSVHKGMTEFWAEVVDPGGALGVRDALTNGRAYEYVNAFVRSARVLEPARVRGAFTVDTGQARGQPTLRLTWKGSAVYAMESIQGVGSLQPVFRQITWSWFEGGGWPGLAYYAHFGNVDICVIAGTGLIKPTPGDIDLPARYLSPESFPRSTEAEQAKQDALVSDC